jgi:hypothetical protein
VTVQTRFHRKDGTWITLESAARNYMDFRRVRGIPRLVERHHAARRAGKDAAPVRAGHRRALRECAEADAFDTEELALLGELTDDLCFGVASLLAGRFAEEHAALKRGAHAEDPLRRLSARERKTTPRPRRKGSTITRERGSKPARGGRAAAER